MAKLLQFKRPDDGSGSFGSERRSSSAHASLDVPLQQKSPGLFTGQVPAAEAGLYTLQEGTLHSAVAVGSANTLELLDGTGIRCPRLHTYLDRLIAYVTEHYKERRARASAEEIEDPLR